jgi:hypothetical protein
MICSHIGTELIARWRRHRSRRDHIRIFHLPQASHDPHPFSPALLKIQAGYKELQLWIVAFKSAWPTAKAMSGAIRQFRFHE